MAICEATYELLDAEPMDAVIVMGKDVLPVAMYLSGSARNQELPFAAKAIVTPEDGIQTFSAALDYAKRSMGHLFNTVRGGTVHTFIGDRITDEDKTLRYNKAVIIQDGTGGWKDQLRKVMQIRTVKRIILSASPEFNVPLMMRDSGGAITFRQLLEKAGFRILFYGNISGRVYVVMKPPRALRDVGEYHFTSRRVRL